MTKNSVPLNAPRRTRRTRAAPVTQVKPVPVPPISPPASVNAGPSELPKVIVPLNQKQQLKKAHKAKEGAIAMRKMLWPNVSEDQLWLLDGASRKGFAQLPRTLPLIMNMIGDVSKRLTGKSVPAGRTYLVLWCRVFTEGFVKIDSEAAAAYEAGYVGERNVTTWREHIRILKEIGFLDFKEGSSGPMQYILLYNPYGIIKQLLEKKLIPENQYTAFYQRTVDIGAASELN